MMAESKTGKGREAEQMATDFLAAKGYAIRERNWRPQPFHYEVDIIAQKGAVIVFVEVKARTDMDTDPAQAVDLRKQKFISRAADIYLRRQPHMYYYRFDIIAVSGRKPDLSIRHIKDAYMAPLTVQGSNRK